MIKLSKAEDLYISETLKNVNALYKRFERLKLLHQTQPNKFRKLNDVHINIQILKDDIYRIQLKITELMQIINLDDFPEN
jgi:hypothetical protein